MPIKVEKLDEIRIAPPKKRGRPPKYNNKRCEFDGQWFDSQKERDWYIVLRQDERDGRITNLQRQVVFNLLPAMAGEYRTERGVKYIADFTYTDQNGKYHVVDVKGMKTEVYKLKRKLMLYRKGISIEEV